MHYDRIRNEQEDDVGVVSDWYVGDETTFCSTKIREEDFERVEKILKDKGIPLNDTTYATLGFNPEAYDTNTFSWNEGAIIYCQRKKGPITLAGNKGIIVDQKLLPFIPGPTHLITIISEHKEKIKNTAYRLGLPLEDLL